MLAQAKDKRIGYLFGREQAMLWVWINCQLHAPCYATAQETRHFCSERWYNFLQSAA